MISGRHGFRLGSFPDVFMSYDAATLLSNKFYDAQSLRIGHRRSTFALSSSSQNAIFISVNHQSLPTISQTDKKIDIHVWRVFQTNNAMLAGPQ
jgi:hypothetical protein